MIYLCLLILHKSFLLCPRISMCFGVHSFYVFTVFCWEWFFYVFWLSYSCFSFFSLLIYFLNIYIFLLVIFLLFLLSMVAIILVCFCGCGFLFSLKILCPVIYVHYLLYVFFGCGFLLFVGRLICLFAAFVDFSAASACAVFWFKYILLFCYVLDRIISLCLQIFLSVGAPLFINEYVVFLVEAIAMVEIFTNFDDFNISVETFSLLLLSLLHIVVATPFCLLSSWMV